MKRVIKDINRERVVGNYWDWRTLNTKAGKKKVVRETKGSRIARI